MSDTAKKSNYGHLVATVTTNNDKLRLAANRANQFLRKSHIKYYTLMQINYQISIKYKIIKMCPTFHLSQFLREMAFATFPKNQNMSMQSSIFCWTF